MSDLAVDKVSIIDVSTIKQVLASSELTNTQKAQFISKNKSTIRNVLGLNISPDDFKTMMNNRPLIKFRPLKNSFTKRGDKILLAKALDIPVSQIDKYVNSVSEDIHQIDRLNIPSGKIDEVKTYIYRHGTKKQLVTFLDYELTNTKNVLKTLYSTLEYSMGGVADYFVRPIHILDNKTMIDLYNVIDKHLALNEKAGNIASTDALKTADWALKKIYQIQNDQRLFKAIKAENMLS